MRVQAYTQFSGVIIVTAASQRVEAAPSHRFVNAKLHEDFCAQVRALLKEHRHIGATALEYPAAKRLQSYLPVFNGSPIYALRELMPAGASRDVDGDFQIEVMRIRYAFVLNLLPGAFLTDEITAEGMEYHVENAVKQLFDANGVPSTFIPADEDQRTDRTDIDILVEMGAATARTGVEIPAPAQ